MLVAAEALILSWRSRWELSNPWEFLTRKDSNLSLFWLSCSITVCSSDMSWESLISKARCFSWRGLISLSASLMSLSKNIALVSWSSICFSNSSLSGSNFLISSVSYDLVGSISSIPDWRSSASFYNFSPDILNSAVFYSYSSIFEETSEIVTFESLI